MVAGSAFETGKFHPFLSPYAYLGGFLQHELYLDFKEYNFGFLPLDFMAVSTLLLISGL